MISRGMLGILMGGLLATTDVTAMSIMKQISLQSFSKIWMVIVTLIYAAQPWIFLKGMNYTGMTVMNLTWDLTSSIIVTFVGLLFFREKLTQTKLLGVGFALIAAFLFAYSSDSK
jgi:multidrug transporter EmrE-like cation transporter